MAKKATSSTGKWGTYKSLHYYAQTMLDIEDIVLTLNRLVEQNIPTLERKRVKSQCMVTGIPVKGRTSSFVLRVDVPMQVIEGSESATRAARNLEAAETNAKSKADRKGAEDKSVV